MNMGSDTNVFTINSLPDELISLILVKTDYQDIVSFGLTCKAYFNGIVKNNQFLWKCKSKDVLPRDIYIIFEQHCKGDWYDEFKKYISINKMLLKELGSMSSKHYWKDYAVSLSDVEIFFSTALKDNISYYYTIRILQDIVKECRRRCDIFRCEKPYTMTEMYYAQMSITYLVHLYLSVKWTKGLLNGDLRPIKVINLFVQWVDTDITHPNDDVTSKIKEVIKHVEALLMSSYPHQGGDGETLSVVERCTKGRITERQVLAAVTQVIYHKYRIAVTPAANLDAIDVVKVLNNKVGNCIVVAAIYQEVTKYFGVDCKLFAFPNHLFLEWRDKTTDGAPLVYTIDLNTGQLQQKRRCPFAPSSESSRYEYSPDSLIQYLHTSFMSSMAAYKNWNTDNAFLLMGFLGGTNAYSAYSHFLHYLYELPQLRSTRTSITLKFLTDEYRQIIRSLLNVNVPCENFNKNTIVKRNDGSIQFAVGMICYHKRLQFLCIIKGWDYVCSPYNPNMIRMDSERLEFKKNQPYYQVIAADQSNRYVAQENLAQVLRPARLYHLEHMIAREFTHYDGFAYVPNAEKCLEYPDDISVASGLRPSA